MQCAVSTTTVVGFAYLLVAVCFDYDWTAIVLRHVVPLLIMNYWLVMVTYLQHHEADTKVRFFFREFVYVRVLFFFGILLLHTMVIYTTQRKYGERLLHAYEDSTALTFPPEWYLV